MSFNDWLLLIAQVGIGGCLAVSRGLSRNDGNGGGGECGIVAGGGGGGGCLGGVPAAARGVARQLQKWANLHCAYNTGVHSK